jgi:hypothetical protein
MQFEYEAIQKALNGQKAHGTAKVTIYLTKGDSAWNPASTKNLIYGPAEVMYEEMPDGAINAYIDGAR